MKTALASSSLAVYQELRGAGFAEMKAKILAKMKPGVTYTRRQLSTLTKIETSSVAGRINELIEAEQVVVCGKKRCPVTGRMVEAIQRAAEQTELFA